MSAFISVAIKLVGVSSHLGLAPVARTGLVGWHEGVLGVMYLARSHRKHLSRGHHFFAPLFYIIVQAHTQARALMTV